MESANRRLISPIDRMIDMNITVTRQAHNSRQSRTLYGICIRPIERAANEAARVIQ